MKMQIIISRIYIFLRYLSSGLRRVRVGHVLAGLTVCARSSASWRENVHKAYSRVGNGLLRSVVLHVAVTAVSTCVRHSTASFGRSSPCNLRLWPLLPTALLLNCRLR